jgi:hypothetical protein
MGQQAQGQEGLLQQLLAPRWDEDLADESAQDLEPAAPPAL